jgi:hypothetical protein
MTSEVTLQLYVINTEVLANKTVSGLPLTCLAETGACGSPVG